MDFIRSLDESEAREQDRRGTGTLGESFGSALENYRRRSDRPASAHTTTFRHQPIKHRPSTFHQVEFESDREEEDNGEEDGNYGSRSPGSLARKMLSRTDIQPVGASKRVESESVQAWQHRTAEEVAARDNGDFFRENEQDSIPADAGSRAGLGPAAHNKILRGELPRSSLGTLEGYKTRDLFASQARRTKNTREQVVLQAAKNPQSYRYRTSADHVLTPSDFPLTKKKDPGYRFGADADLNSSSHPEVVLGLHKFRPTLDEKKLEQQIQSLSEQHMKRRLAEQTLFRSVYNQVQDYTKAQERREEETTRKQEDSYRQLFEQQDAEERAKEQRRKSRPASAPMAAAHARKHTHQSSTTSLASMVVEEETLPPLEEIDGPITQEELDKRDPRTAISHPDVQLLQQQQKLIDEADQLEKNRPAGFSSRPSTASKFRVARWAEESKRGSGGHETGHVHDASCSHGSGGTFSHSSSHSTLPTRSRPTSAATKILHQHRPGSASLQAYHQPMHQSTGPSVASAGASVSLAATASGGAAVSSLPLPVPLIESHFRQEAWSQAKREEFEIEGLMRGMQEMALPASNIPDESPDDENVVFEDSIAGAAAARMKHEMKKAEKARAIAEAKAQAKQQRDAQREKLKYKTEVWEPHRLGIVPMDETEKDLTLAAQKSKNLQLVRAGIPLPAKVPTHDVAFNSSVVKRKVPPPKARTGKKKPNEAEGETKEPPSTAGTRRSASSKKVAPAPKRPASVSATLGKVEALARHKKDADFVEALYRPEGLLGETVEKMQGARNVGGEGLWDSEFSSSSKDQPLRNTSHSLYRSSQDPESRRKDPQRQRPWSAHPNAQGGLSVAPVGGTVADLNTALNSSSLVGTGQQIRPATASLLGHSISHPQLLKTPAARAGSIAGLLSHVHAHVAQSEALSTVENVKEALSRVQSAHPIRISRATLEHALLAPHVVLSQEQKTKYPPQVGANLAVNPFLVPKKKKLKRRKGSSKKKKGSSKKKKSTTKKVVEPEGLAFPLGTSTSEFANNPLVSDLGLINLGDLIGSSSSGEKSEFRSIYLKHASHLMLVFDFYSSKTSSSGLHTPSLMSQLRWLQFLWLIGTFNPSNSPSAPAVTIRQALEIFTDDDDLSVENIDVDELISRPAFLERLARIAVLKCGTVKPLPPAPLGEVQPTQPVPMSPAEALETFILKFVLPNALSVSPHEFRMRLLDEKVQSVFSTHNIPLQTMFSFSAAPSEGVVTYDNVKLMLKDCDIPPSAAFVEKSIKEMIQGSSITDPLEARFFYPELLELFARMSDLATPSADLAGGLSAFLHNAWTSFTQRVPTAIQVASSIAASHQSAAALATGGSKTNTPRDTRVKFA